VASITPKNKGGISNKPIRDSLIETSDLLKKASNNDIINKGPVLIKVLQEAVNWYKKVFLPKIPLEQIVEEFKSLYKDEEIYSWGLEYGWLQKVMDYSNIGFLEELMFLFKNYFLLITNKDNHSRNYYYK
jgi:hypothetical protein